MGIWPRLYWGAIGAPQRREQNAHFAAETIEIECEPWVQSPFEIPVPLLIEEGKAHAKLTLN
jgi:hypothetical protein